MIFWKTIGKFRTRKRKKGRNIRKKTWDKHFRDLLGVKTEESCEERLENDESSVVRRGERRNKQGDKYSRGKESAKKNEK